MTRTIDNMLDAHHAANARREAGRPSWAAKLNLHGVFDNQEMTRAERNAAIVGRIRASAWPRITEEPDELADLLEELADTDETDWFNAVMDRLYDLANTDRVWIITWAEGPQVMA